MDRLWDQKSTSLTTSLTTNQAWIESGNWCPGKDSNLHVLADTGT
jgi:hypothetical protein